MAGIRSEIKRTVTLTKVHYATIGMVDGEAVIQHEGEQVFAGRLSVDKALKKLQETHGANITVLSATPETAIYSMDVTDFAKYGKKQTEKDDK